MPFNNPIVTLVDSNGASYSASNKLPTLTSQVVLQTESIATTGNAVISNYGCQYQGFSLKETTGSTPAAVRIWNHASAASGTLLEEITLGAGESAREFYPNGGIQADLGLYIQVVSGAISGVVRRYSGIIWQAS